MSVKNFAIKALASVVTSLGLVATAVASTEDSTAWNIQTLIRSIKGVVFDGGELIIITAYAAGAFFVVAGIIAWVLSGKTQNQNQTKSYAVYAFVGGILLGSVGKVMDMGANQTTGQSSEFNTFYTQDDFKNDQ